jgi:hypothetical protein
MGSDVGGRRPAECYNMRVIDSIYSLEVTRTIIAHSGFRLNSYSLGAEWAD